LKPEAARPVVRFLVSFPKEQEVDADLLGVSFAPVTRRHAVGICRIGVERTAKALPPFARPDQRRTAAASAKRVMNPTFSPDGQSVVFSAPIGILKVVSLAGGPPIVLTDSAIPAVQASWGQDGWVLLR